MCTPAVSHPAEARKCPALAVTCEGNEEGFLEMVVPEVDFVEVTPDTLSEVILGEVRLHPNSMAGLKQVAQRVGVVAHGVGLSIASHDDLSRRYLRVLDQLFGEIPVEWHSEHLAYTLVDGESLGTMLPPPRTQESLDLISRRVDWIQRRYPKPFLLEHVIRLLPEHPPAFSDARFLNSLCDRTGCGLILDAYNLECDIHNNGFDLDAFLDELNPRHIHEMHLACGAEESGLKLDVHSRPVADSTLLLAEQVLSRSPENLRLITFELLREFFPRFGATGLAAELRRIRGWLEPLFHDTRGIPALP